MKCPGPRCPGWTSTGGNCYTQPSGMISELSGHEECCVCVIELTGSSYDFRNKTVGVIGNGSSSIQIVPSLQPLEGIKMTVFMRSPTWISGAFGDAAMIALGLDPTDSTCEGLLLTFRPRLNTDAM